MSFVDDLEVQAVAGSDEALAVLLDHHEAMGVPLLDRQRKHAQILINRFKRADPTAKHVEAGMRELKRKLTERSEHLELNVPDDVVIPPMLVETMGLAILRLLASKPGQYVRERVGEGANSVAAYWEPERASRPARYATFRVVLTCHFSQEGWIGVGLASRARLVVHRSTYQDYADRNFCWINEHIGEDWYGIPVEMVTAPKPMLEYGFVSGCGGQL